MDEDSSTYLVKETEGVFEVWSSTGRCIMSCSDSASAQHYALLLNDAYRLGYKQAFRDRD